MHVTCSGSSAVVPDEVELDPTEVAGREGWVGRRKPDKPGKVPVTDRL